MDVIPDSKSLTGPEFSLNNFGSFYNQVFIKQEEPEEAPPDQARYGPRRKPLRDFIVLYYFRAPRFEGLQTISDEVKLEKPEYPGVDPIQFNLNGDQTRWVDVI